MYRLEFRHMISTKSVRRIATSLVRFFGETAYCAELLNTLSLS